MDCDPQSRCRSETAKYKGNRVTGLRRVLVAAQIRDSGGASTRRYFALYAGGADVDEPWTNKHYTSP
jgi:hypothetical protein